MEVGAWNVQRLQTLWQSQPLDRVKPCWLVNQHLADAAMSPDANRTRYLSHSFISGKIEREVGVGVNACSKC